MSFVHYVQQGPWKKIWLAAHFEKKLKMDEVQSADVEELIASVQNHRDQPTLRHTAHLLTGTCRIFRKKTEFYHHQVQEVRTKITMAFTNEHVREDEEEKEEGKMPCDKMDFLLHLKPEHIQDDYKAHKTYVAPFDHVTLPQPPTIASPTDLNENDIHWFEAGKYGQLPKRIAHLEIEDLEPESVPHVIKRPDGDIRRQIGATLVPDTVVLPPEFMDDRAAAPEILPQDDMDGFPMDEPLEDYCPPVVPSPYNDDDFDPYGVGPGPQQMNLNSYKFGDDMVNTKTQGKRRKKERYLWDKVVDIPEKDFYMYTENRAEITLPPQKADVRLPLKSAGNFMDSALRCHNALDEKAIEILKRARLSEWKKNHGDETPEWEKKETPQEQEFPEIPEPDFDDIGGNFEDPLPIEDDFVAPLVQQYRPPEGVMMNMSHVIQGGMDEEELDVCTTRVGFSSRTQKMELLLEQEMKNQADDDCTGRNTKHTDTEISFDRLRKDQDCGSRHKAAACFFELLVLKTNGVIEVSQESAYADIKINQGDKWGENVLTLENLKENMINETIPVLPQVKLEQDGLSPKRLVTLPSPTRSDDSGERDRFEGLDEIPPPSPEIEPISSKRIRIQSPIRSPLPPEDEEFARPSPEIEPTSKRSRKTSPMKSPAVSEGKEIKRQKRNRNKLNTNSSPTPSISEEKENDPGTITKKRSRRNNIPPPSPFISSPAPRSPLPSSIRGDSPKVSSLSPLKDLDPIRSPSPEEDNPKKGKKKSPIAKSPTPKGSKKSSPSPKISLRKSQTLELKNTLPSPRASPSPRSPKPMTSPIAEETPIKRTKKEKEVVAAAGDSKEKSDQKSSSPNSSSRN